MRRRLMKALQRLESEVLRVGRDMSQGPMETLMSVRRPKMKMNDHGLA